MLSEHDRGLQRCQHVYLSRYSWGHPDLLCCGGVDSGPQFTTIRDSVGRLCRCSVSYGSRERVPMTYISSDNPREPFVGVVDVLVCDAGG